MTIDEFNVFMDHTIENHIRGVMCAKSAEYASGADKLHNFKKAARMRGLPPEECLRMMKLKHDVSLDDMLNELNTLGKEYPKKCGKKNCTTASTIYSFCGLFFRSNMIGL